MKDRDDWKDSIPPTPWNALGGLVLAIRTIRVLRWLKWHRFVSKLRGRGMLSTLSELHAGAIHAMRDFAAEVQRWDDQRPDAHNAARRACTTCAEVMRNLLELDAHSLHCCLKVHVKGQAKDEDYVATWMRSQPGDDRDKDDRFVRHRVAMNSAWASLLGGSDGAVTWTSPLNCFACDDLTEHEGTYRNTRENFRQFYRSTVVYPLHYTIGQPGNRRCRTIGFLAFDSDKTRAFIEMPCIYRFCPTGQGLPAYRAALDRNPVFHLGAIMADVMAMFLGPAYEKHAAKEERAAKRRAKQENPQERR